MASLSGTVYIQSDSGKETPAGSFSDSKNDLQKLDELERRANLVIFEVQSLLPLFSGNKDKITICLNRITITRGNVFSGEEYPMAIENITSARIFRHMMFASIEFDTFGVVKPEPVSFINIKHARLARRYILGLIECKKAGIDLISLELDNLRDKLKNIGMVRYSVDDSDYHSL